MKDKILTRDECLAILSDIAMGHVVKADRVTITPSAEDQMEAIQLLAKMQGWYAPAKYEITLIDRHGATRAKLTP